MQKLRVVALLALVGLGLAASLSACVIEDDGGHGGWHDHHDWH